MVEIFRNDSGWIVFLKYASLANFAVRSLLSAGGPNTSSIKMKYETTQQSSLYNISHVMRKPVYAICEQQRCRSACASAQSWKEPHLQQDLNLWHIDLNWGRITLGCLDTSTINFTLKLITATNPSPSPQIPMGQNFLFLVFENKI